MSRKKVVIAPDSFKESLTAMEVATAVEEGFRKIHPHWDYAKIPMADGGEGTLQSLVDATAGAFRTVHTKDPLGHKIEATFGLLNEGKQAIIEMATASGLELVESSKRDPMRATSWGLGDLIRGALDEEVEEIIIGIGGSATNDGGAGMIQALGGKLLDCKGEQIPLGGAGLSELAAIDRSALDPRLKNVNIVIASDVNNPLTGPNGASYIYGPQKGATSDQVQELDENLKHFAEVIHRDLKQEIAEIPGAGAAGGVGGALLAFLDAELRNGGEVIVEKVHLEEAIKEADLVLTGEGGINHQTIYGKTPIVVAQVAKKYELPVIAIAGSLSEDYEEVYEQGIDAVFSIIPQVTDLEMTLAEGFQNIVATARNIAKTIELSEKI